MSFEQIHAINKHATPQQIMIYKHSLLLYKIWNDSIYSKDWLVLNFQQNLNEKCTHLMLFESSNFKVGKNLPTNRFKIINGLINFDWLNVVQNKV